ncbi:ATP-grasp fold amidoligase family protein [Trinickia acidisoli]|uniref:ATP-grasp fold amidoligase family protein n=1 Tax=Trinickia acidisoli TaxID=2767482 RepID=UPI001A8CDCE5|nr:ATP-grasp fold amidoligase family protein [Trinickia acidisoli]
MPNVVEPDPHQPKPIAPPGCGSAALALPRAGLPVRGERADSPATLGAGKQREAARASRAWLGTRVRNALRALKHILPDTLFLWLSHRRHVGRFPNLIAPKTFNEFILHRCLHPEPQWSMLADKLAVREFVRQRIGEEYLVPLIAVPDVFTEDVFDSLPDSFVMKTNHGCGYVEIVEDKRRTSFEHLNRLAQKWLAEDFYRASRERHYRPIKPRLYFEQLLLDRTGNVPADLKMNMFGRDAAGPIIYAGIVSDRFGTPHGDVFDVRWNQLDLAVGHYPRSKVPPPPPPHWDEIVRLATRLADGLGYVRVDLYVPDGKVYFGELTFTPGAGVFPFHPDRYDYEWGQLFKNMIEGGRRTDRSSFKQGSPV